MILPLDKFKTICSLLAMKHVIRIRRLNTRSIGNNGQIINRFGVDIGKWLIGNVESRSGLAILFVDGFAVSKLLLSLCVYMSCDQYAHRVTNFFVLSTIGESDSRLGMFLITLHFTVLGNQTVQHRNQFNQRLPSD